MPHSASSRRTALISALDGSAFSIPLTLGCAALLYAKVAPELLSQGVLASMLALIWIHVVTAGAQRPILYAGRLFEATTMAAMIERGAPLLSSWGLPDSSSTRVTMLCLTGGLAGLWLGALFLMRADRFTRYIPAPVYAGFANSIAVLLLLAEFRAAQGLLSEQSLWWATASVLALVLVTGLAVRYLRPRWPSASIALFAGLLLASVWHLLGTELPTVSAHHMPWALPVSYASFAALLQPQVQWGPLSAHLLGDALIMGTMMFLNTTIAAQTLTQQDERRNHGMRDPMISSTSLALICLTGSVPISGSNTSCTAATRHSQLERPAIWLSAAVGAVALFSGLLAWIPLAAVAAALTCEAWFMFDRGSLQLARRWLRREALPHNTREDLGLIAAVTISAVLINMVVSVFVGLLLGLSLYAARNGRKPVRHVWSGAQMQSNCARPRSDMRMLSRLGERIRVFELQGDLFFGATEALDGAVRPLLGDIDCAVFDWTLVRHIDTSVTLTMSNLERHALRQGVTVWHSGAERAEGNVAATLKAHFPQARFAPDLDRALEQAETALLQQYASEYSHETTTVLEAYTLFQGLTDAERTVLDSAMMQRFIPAGQPLVRNGEPSDALLVLMAGSASIMITDSAGHEIRLAGVRRGATVGEIGFLDGAPRSASVVAQEDSTVAILGRDAFDTLRHSHPQIVHRILSNIALDVAVRLRNTTRLAVAKRTGG